mgnify:CR=1 FL=1
MDKNFHKKVGKNIKNMREKRGISQFKLAIETNCTPSTIAGIEAGINTTLARLQAIAKVLEVEPYELLKID